MNDKILFMIINNEVKYLQNSTMDHREWYTHLGFDPNQFDNIIRGYILENKIVFFKGMNFNYDEEVINMAKTFGPSIIAAWNNPNLEVYCGIVITSYGSKWEPVLHLKKEELVAEKPKQVEKKVPKEQKETVPILDLKNDFNDDSFRKKAMIVTGSILILTIIIKIILFSKKEILQLNNSTDIILAFVQVGLLSFIIYGYYKKIPSTKYLSLVASILLVLTLDIWDVILGILYFIFSVDQGYFIRTIDTVKQKIKEKREKNV